ncbi:MAG TPA: hypothetical protein VL443_23975 [Cyclobacteriaceae bacterium]|jgi:hypothetical protein|nr:hypothetical protein [Cyclobacteriaceae bacterium]
MKKFKYPLAIEGTTEQLKELSIKLLELGYVIGSKITNTDRYLLTNWCDELGTLGYDHLRNYRDRYDVSASNPDLVLALAAMVDDDDINPGELFYCHKNLVMDNDYRIAYKKNHFYKSELHGAITDEYNLKEHWMSGVGVKASKWLRKATKEEIISHFSPQTFNGSEPKTMEKKIIGYKLKDDCKQYEEAASAILRFSNGKLTNYAEGYNFTFTSPASDFLKKAGVLDLWFEPVYEEKFKVGDWIFFDGKSHKAGPYKLIERVRENLFRSKDQCHETKSGYRLATPEEITAAQTKVITLRCEGGTFEIEVSKRGIYYKPEDKWLDIAALNQAVNPVITSVNVSGYDFKLVIDTIDSGCKKKVSILEWKKVLSAYNEICK